MVPFLWAFNAIACGTGIAAMSRVSFDLDNQHLDELDRGSNVTTGPARTRHFAALMQLLARAQTGAIVLGPGLRGRADQAEGEIRLLHHVVIEGGSVREDLGNVLSWIEVSPQLDLDAHDPWLESLDDEQRRLYARGDLERPIDGNIDLLAWYWGYHEHSAREIFYHDPDEAGWGIYLSTAGIETLAREAFLPRLSPDEALTVAARALYGHELFHFLTEVAITTRELQAAANGDVGIRDWFDHRAFHDGRYCETEEALAHAHALRLSEPAHRDLLRSWMRHGPVGYRDFHRYDDHAPATREALRELLTHSRPAGVAGVPALAELAFDLAHVHNGLGDVPLHLVVSPGSAYEAGEWSWTASRLADQP